MTLKQRWQQFFPVTAPVDGWVHVGMRRLYVLPSRLGLAYLAMIAFMFSGAVNYNLSLGYGLLFWLVSVMLITALHSNLNLANLRLRGQASASCFAGELQALTITVQQDKVQWRPTLVLRQGEHRSAFDLQQGEISVTLNLPTDKRGWFKPGRLILETYYPLGLFRCWTIVDLDIQGLVYPKREERSPPLPAHAPSPREGKLSMLGGDEFVGLREWRQGDAPRMIAWRQSARNDRLMTRVLQSPQGSQLWLDWDTLPQHLGTEGRLSRLCSWVHEAEARGLHYGLRLPGVTYPPAYGPAHMERCLAALALY